MKPLLLILDDWEGLIQKAACWNQLKDLLEIKFLKDLSKERAISK